MRRPIVPVCCAVVAVALWAGVAGAGGPPAPAGDVAKTTIPPASTGPNPTAPVPTAPTVAPTLAPPTITGTAPGVPTTEPSGLSPESLAIALPIFGLDMSTLQCVDAALPSLGSDDSVAVAALQGCGVAVMPLLRGIVAVIQESNTFLDPTATTLALPAVPGIDALPTEDSFLLGFMLLIDTTTASCLATGLSGVTVEDDATALSIFERCDVSIAFTLDMLTFALVGDFAVDPSATTTPTATAPAPTVSVAVPTAAGATVPGGAPTTLQIAPDDPLVDQFQELLLQQQGITLDDAQASCLLSHIGSSGEIDTEDIAAMFELMESCGIGLSDLVPTDPKRVTGTLAGS